MNKAIPALIVIGILFAVVMFAAGSVFENLEAENVMVIQAPFSGKLTWYVTPGWKWQWFGSITKYKKRDELDFRWYPEPGKNRAIKIRFNDGGHADVGGAISWEMPDDEKHLTALHVRYGSHEKIESQLIKAIVEKTIFMTGPLMTSTESYAARRNDLLNLIDDQIVRGIFKTEVTQERQKDVMTGADKTVSVVKLVKDDKGMFARQDDPPLDEFKIRTFNLVINNIKYDPMVEKQIEQQQTAIMQVQTAIARAKESEQEAISAEKKGQAEAAKAKWEQEVIKAKEVTKGEMLVKVAELGVKTEELNKKSIILKGEGEATARTLVMTADGALDKKLEAYTKVQQMWATAFQNFKGDVVPHIVYGQQPGPANAAMNAMDILNVKALKELGLDTNIRGNKGNKDKEK